MGKKKRGNEHLLTTVTIFANPMESLENTPIIRGATFDYVYNRPSVLACNLGYINQLKMENAKHVDNLNP